MNSKNSIPRVAVSPASEHFAISCLDPKLLDITNKGILSLAHPPKELFTFGNDLYILDHSGTLMRTSSLSAFKICSTNVLLSEVSTAVANKYCVLALKQNGSLFALGSDDIKIGILGLGSQTRKTPTFACLNLEDSVRCVSLADTYAVALADSGDLYIWGTTQEKFFGDGIGTTHFLPTKLTFSAELSIHRIFAHSEALFLLLESNEIECITRFYSDNKSTASGYRLPKFSDGRVSFVSPFGRFVALMTSTGGIFVYHHQCRELSFLGEGFHHMSGSKNRLVAFESKARRLHVLSVPIYTNVALSSLQRRVIELNNCSASLLLCLPRLDTSILALDQIQLSAEQYQTVTAHEVSLPGPKINDPSNRNMPVVTSGVNSRTVIFEESYIRMRYKEIKELKRQEDKMRISGYEQNRNAANRKEIDPDQRSDYSRDASTRQKIGEKQQLNSKGSSYSDFNQNTSAGMKHVSSGPLQGVTEHQITVEGSRSDARAEIRKNEVRPDSDFDDISNYSQTGRSGSKGSHIKHPETRPRNETQPQIAGTSIFDAFHNKYFSKRFPDHKRSESSRDKEKVAIQGTAPEISEKETGTATNLQSIYLKLKNKKHSNPQNYLFQTRHELFLGKQAGDNSQPDSSVTSQGRRSPIEDNTQGVRSAVSEAMLITENFDNVHSLQTIPMRSSEVPSPQTDTEPRMSRAELEKYKKNSKLLEHDRTLSKESLKSRSRSSKGSNFRRSQEKFVPYPTENPNQEGQNAGKQLNQNPSTGALGSRNSFNFSLSQQNSPSGQIASHLAHLREQLQQEQKKFTQLGVVRAPLNSMDCLTMSISSMGGTQQPLGTSIQQNLLKSPTDADYNHENTIRTMPMEDGIVFGLNSDPNFHSVTNLHQPVHPESVHSGESLPIRSLAQSQGPTPEAITRDLNIKTRLVSEFAILESLAEEQDENSTLNIQASKKESNSRLGASSGLIVPPTKQTSKEFSGLDDLYSPDPTHRETERMFGGKGLSSRENDMADKGYEIGAYGIPEYKKSSGTATPFRDFEGSSNAPGSLSNDINRTIKGETPLMTGYQVISNTNSQSKDLQVDTLQPFPKATQVMVTQFLHPSQEQSQIELQIPSFPTASAVAEGLQDLSPHLRLALQNEAAFVPNVKAGSPYGSQTMHHSSSPGLLNTANQELESNSSGVRGIAKPNKEVQSPKNKPLGFKPEDSGLLGQSQSQPNVLTTTAMFGGPLTLLEQIQHTHSSLSSKTSQNNSLHRVEVKLHTGWRVVDENGDPIQDDVSELVHKDTIHSRFAHQANSQLKPMDIEAGRQSSIDSKNRHKGGSCCAKPSAIITNDGLKHSRSNSSSHKMRSPDNYVEHNDESEGPQMVPERGFYDPVRRRTVYSGTKQSSKDKSMVSAASRDSSKTSPTNGGLNSSKEQKTVEPPPYQQRVLPKPPAEVPYRKSLNKLKGLCNKDSIDGGRSRSRSGGARSSAASGGSRHHSIDISFNFLRNNRAANVVSKTDDSAYRNYPAQIYPNEDVEQLRLDSKLNSPAAILNSVKKAVQSSALGSRSHSRKKGTSNQNDRSSAGRSGGESSPAPGLSPLSSAVKQQSAVSRPQLTQVSASKKKMSMLRAHAKKTIQEAKQRESHARKGTENSQVSKSGYYVPEGVELDANRSRIRSPAHHLHHSMQTGSVLSTSMHQHPAKDLVRIWQAVYMRKIRDAFAQIVQMGEHKKTIRTLQTVMDLKADLKRLKTHISSKTSVMSSADKKSQIDNRSFDLESQMGARSEKLGKSNLNNSELNKSSTSSKEKRVGKTISPIRDTPKSEETHQRKASVTEPQSSGKKQEQATAASKSHPTSLRIDTSGSQSKAGKDSASSGTGTISGVKSALLEHFNSVSHIAGKRGVPQHASNQQASSPLFGWPDLHLQQKYYEPGAFKLCIIQDD